MKCIQRDLTSQMIAYLKKINWSDRYASVVNVLETFINKQSCVRIAMS